MLENPFISCQANTSRPFLYRLSSKSFAGASLESRLLFSPFKFLLNRNLHCFKFVSLMEASSSRGGGFYGATPYRSRDGLSTRQVGGSEEIQLRIDPMQGDLDDHVTGMRKQVKLLRNVAQEIETEAKFQNDFLNQMQMTLIKAQAGVKKNMRILSKSLVQQGSSHVIHVVLFALVCFFMVYLLARSSRR
ncbi:hypothetical protein NMG60_11031373 [Bertholletia excelsa]